MPDPRNLRPRATQAAGDGTPESGQTTTTTTETWSHGTSHTNATGSRSNSRSNLQSDRSSSRNRTVPLSVPTAEQAQLPVAQPELAAPPAPQLERESAEAPPAPRSEYASPTRSPPLPRHPARVHDDKSADRNSMKTLVNANRDKDIQLSVLMAELEVRKAELELARKAADEANSRLQIARVASQSVSASIAQERVVGWVESHYEDRAVIRENRELNPGFSALQNRSNLGHIRDSDAIGRNDPGQSREIVGSCNRAPYGPLVQRQIPELPHFDGNISEWIAFRAEFEDSAPSFSNVNNVSRIRKALRGEARIAVKSIMYTVTDPYEIMEALERHFGDPEEIVLTEIHNVKKMPRLSDDSSNIVTFAGHVANTVATIKALRQEQYLYAPELVSKIVDKLNVIVRYEWAKYRQANLGMPELVAMATFLNEISSAARRTHHRYVRTRANVHTANGREFGPPPPAPRRSAHFPAHPPTPRHRDYYSDSDSDNEQQNLVAAVSTQSRNPRKPAQSRPPAQSHNVNNKYDANKNKKDCVVCQGNHKVAVCADFLKKSVADRWDIAKGNKLCFRCLDPNHRRPVKCKYVPCGINQCEAGHNKLLHGLNAAIPQIQASVSSVNQLHKSNTYLKVVPVEISGSLGTVSTFALLDEGSTMTLIERETADLITPREVGEPLSIEGIGGQVTDSESCRISVNIRGHCARNMEKLNAFTIDRLNLSSQEVSRDIVEQCKHLCNIIDELCYERATPTILIGQDNWNLIVSRQLLCGEPTLPIASLTKLGWILHGQYHDSRARVARINHVRPATTEDEILKCMKEHFSIESLGVESKLNKSDPNQRALTILDSTCKKIPGENRYEAGLLWRTDDETLPDNRAHALRRLYSLERKLDADDSLKTEYTAQVKNLLDKGYAEKIDSRPPQDASRTWYLPHFGTRHAQKGKLRLVFDAKATAYGTSLNQSLLAGPDLLKSLFGVLIRFREGKTAIIADVKEMFLQVGVSEQDRDSLRFLWRGEDRSGPPQEYRMKRLIFGAASSPTTALYVKNKNATELKNVYPIAADITIRNTYMDDMLVALDKSEHECRQIVNDIYKLNMQASFELRGFASNNPNVVSDVQPRESECTVIGKSDTERTLGLIWNHKKDTLGFNVNLRNTPAEVINGSVLPTKRQVTSSAMSIFDPIGYASPITVLGKSLMQEIWRSGIGWDDQITPECRAAWISFIGNLDRLRNLEIPRYVPTTERKGDLHIFCDASEKIYATAVYLVGRDVSGSIKSTLIAAKARAAPLKTISIPRLELQSCVLGVRLAEAVVEESDYVIENRYYWSDSRTVLAWIKADPRTFKSFVAHRLAEIENSTTPADWRWVPSALNVADDATKGAPAGFDSNHRWFSGPEFIRKGIENWPTEKQSIPPPPPSGEERNVAITYAVTNKLNFDYLPNVDRFSRFVRLVRSTARVLVAAEAFKTRKLSREPVQMNNGHLKIAELLLMKRSQQISFEEEVKLTKRSQPLPRRSPIHRVAVRMNKADVMVLDARTDRGEVDLPVLHAKEDFTKLLIQYYHEKYNHGNHSTVINEIKQNYYVIGLRSTMRYICNKCQWCRTYKGAPLKAPVGDLPKERLLAYQPPFTATAIDLFGPMHITIGRRREKRWGVLFTCLTTRAVHLELAASLSASSTILALRRMMARRGVPTIIYTDNGTNFIGAEREIAEAKKTLPESLSNHPSARNITWKKIPPGNPAAGGAWERMVGCVKAALKVTLKEKAPHEEVLHTLLLEAEQIVNSRPLTPVSTNIEEVSLTPNHFLIMRTSALTPWGSFKDHNLTLSSWKTAQDLADTFWKKWIHEYRPLLSPRASTYNKDRSPAVKDVVIIADNTMPRGTWPRGIVAKTFPGPDGHVRLVEVQTASGILRRPTNRLIPIC